MQTSDTQTVVNNSDSSYKINWSALVQGCGDNFLLSFAVHLGVTRYCEWLEMLPDTLHD